MKKEENSLSEQGSVFAPLARDGLVNRVADTLVDAILSGQLSPGDRLAESTIAKQMDLSRAPVREALRLLENSGLVEYKNNRGFFVHSITTASLEQLYELRIVIETAAIARLVQTNAEEAVRLLEDQVEEMRRLSIDPGDIMAHVDADMEFHRLICSASGNPRFLQMFDQISNEIRFVILVIGRLYDDAMTVTKTHEPIIAAIEARDAEAAVAALRYHLGDAQSRVIELFNSNQEAKQQ
ncbi:GntR family transcriptional regulator [Hwanghaeella sp.]|uniref:GntR family transcriptional regulator n=1 Tax=Hwanghaeella sp. TaxID=2605943 RepID=UPI003CCBCEDC